MDTNGPQSSNACKEQTRLGFYRDADNFLNKLFSIWDKLGMDEHQKRTRSELARSHAKHLFGNMIEEEEQLMARLEKTIAEYTEKLNKLCEELSTSPIKVPTDLTMVKKDKYLRTKVDVLSKEKNDRMAKYEALHAKDQELCNILSATPYYIAASVPSQEQLKECEKHVNQLQAEKDKRFAQFVASKKKIIDLYNLMGSDPDTSFGHDLVCEDDSTFQLSTRNMDQLNNLLESLTMLNDEMATEVEDLWERLHALWNRLETPDIDREAFEGDKTGHNKAIIEALKAEIEACEKLKFENMRKFIDGIRNELRSWWDKCYYSNEQRQRFKAFYDDECTEELLNAHEEELESLRKYYNRFRDLFEKLAHREELFQKMIVMEEEANDANRYKNRGGKLLQEEKARKKVLKDLPKVEEEIAGVVQKWESENGQEFRLKGLRYPDFVEQSWSDFHAHKEQQKQSRRLYKSQLQARAKQTHDDMLYGTKSISCTPNKRKVALPATPVRTPLKTRKIAESMTLSVKVKVDCGTVNSFRTPGNTSTRKRRSIRLIQKAATERRPVGSRRKSREVTFSHTTVSSDDHATSTLASHGSYNDFANGLSKPNCRSSVVPTNFTPLHKH